MPTYVSLDHLRLRSEIIRSATCHEERRDQEIQDDPDDSQDGREGLEVQQDLLSFCGAPAPEILRFTVLSVTCSEAKLINALHALQHLSYTFEDFAEFHKFGNGKLKRMLRCMPVAVRDFQQ